MISNYCAVWKRDRIPKDYLTLLRFAIYDILHCVEIPQSVSINEAVELAKEYSTQDSAKFINGILGSFARARTTPSLPDS
jgi:N utilization substance protein B